MRERKNGQIQQWDIFSTDSQRSVITRKICKQCHTGGERGNEIWLGVLFRQAVWKACLPPQIKLLRISHYGKVFLEKYSSDSYLTTSVPYACTEYMIIRNSVTLMSLVNSSPHECLFWPPILPRRLAGETSLHNRLQMRSAILTKPVEGTGAATAPWHHGPVRGVGGTQSCAQTTVPFLPTRT